MASPPRPSASPRRSDAVSAVDDGLGAPRPTRPFSDSARHGGSLLTVLVLFGRGLDAPSDADAAGGVYVVLSVESLASDRHNDNDDDRLYTLRSPPFAATRVVERGASPAWNELLTLPLPPDWRARGRRPLALKLELVDRGASPQEDFLLAACGLPLAAAVPRPDVQTRLALPISAAETTEASDRDSGSWLGPALFVAVHEHSREAPRASDLRVELTVQSFAPSASALPPSLAMSLRRSDDHWSTDGPLDSLFQTITDSGAQLAPSPPSAMTPFATRLSGQREFAWLYPLPFGQPSAEVMQLEVVLLGAGHEDAAMPIQVGRGTLALAHGSLVVGDGVVVQLPPVAISSIDGATDSVLGHASIRARAWNADAWEAFARGVPARRVVCSNRSPATTPAWLDAILRGLRRHPVASLCDDGGVASVLAELLSQRSSSERPPIEAASAVSAVSVVSAVDAANSSSITQLLKDHVALLTAQSTAQRQQIEQARLQLMLQQDLDARVDAIEACRLEIAALKRDLQLKNEQIAQLTTQAAAARQREHKRTTQLLDVSALQGTRPDDPVAQRLRALLVKYSELEEEHAATKQELVDARQSATALQQLEVRHAELQQAHLVQTALVQRLQRDKQQAGVLRKAVRVQEKVIRQFEQTVAGHLDVDDRGAERDARAREHQLSVRTKVLEEQLATNAREAAAEISALRLRVAELELRGGKPVGGKPRGGGAAGFASGGSSSGRDTRIEPQF